MMPLPAMHRSASQLAVFPVPDESPTQNLGKTEHIWVDPSDTNKILLATYGGLFKTSDGGVNWNCITDGAPVVGGILSIGWIAVKPNNKNIIYLGTTNSFNTTQKEFSWRWNYGAGLVYSIDGGVTWNQELLTGGSTPIWEDSVKEVHRVYFSPNSNRLYAFADDKVYFRTYPNGTWNILSLPAVGTYRDLEFLSGDPNHFFIASWSTDGIASGGIWDITYNPSSQTDSINQINIGSITMVNPNNPSITSYYQ